MIILDDSLFIAKGYSRSAYNHPQHKNLCVKIVHENDGYDHQKRQKRDVKFYKELQQKGRYFDQIPSYLGHTETNLGRGYVYEKVIDHDGKTSCDLMTVLSSYTERNESILKSLKDLGKFLLEEQIFFHDKLCNGNILCRKRADLSYEPVIVDGLGDTILIPILNYIPAVTKSRIIRKWDRYLVNPACKSFEWIKREDLTLAEFS